MTPHQRLVEAAARAIHATECGCSGGSSHYSGEVFYSNLATAAVNAILSTQRELVEEVKHKWAYAMWRDLQDFDKSPPDLAGKCLNTFIDELEG